MQIICREKKRSLGATAEQAGNAPPHKIEPLGFGGVDPRIFPNDPTRVKIRHPAARKANDWPLAPSQPQPENALSQKNASDWKKLSAVKTRRGSQIAAWGGGKDGVPVASEKNPG